MAKIDFKSNSSAQINNWLSDIEKLQITKMMQGMIHPAQRRDSLKIEDVCDWIISQGNKYPGMHCSPTERTQSN